MGISDLADHVAWLPPGCAFWQSIGGPLSVTAEVEQQRWLDYRLRVLQWMDTKDAQDGRNQPAPPEKIPFASERAAKAAKTAEKGSRWQRIQERREAMARQQAAT